MHFDVYPTLTSKRFFFSHAVIPYLYAQFSMTRFAEGSIFRPRISPLVDTKELVSSYNISEVIRSISSSSSSSSNSDVVNENNGTTIAAASNATTTSGSNSATVISGLGLGLVTSQARGSNTTSTSTSLNNKKRRGVGSTFLSGVASISQQIQPLQQIGRPGKQ